MVLTETMVVAFISTVLAGNGVFLYFFKRKDKIPVLTKMNDRQADQIFVMSTALVAVMESQELLVDTLHDKDILNGETAKVKSSIKKAKDIIDDYSIRVMKSRLKMGEM